MSLSDYQKKRNFKKTKEPSGRNDGSHDNSQSIFVVQKHDASRLHYDFRLEVDGVLKSWAVPKGPSLNPKNKRLAMMVEDHPFSYRNFEGQIAEGNYGAGQVIVWDTGTYTIGNLGKKEREAYMRKAIEDGKIIFDLHGQKLTGQFALAKMHTKDANAWLLLKHHDESEREDDNFSSASVLSEQFLDQDITETQSKPLPDFFTPMLATLVDRPFTSKEWIYEYKYDGYRSLAFIDKKNTHLYSRNNILLDKKFPLIKSIISELPFQAIIDGEIVGMNENGTVEFQILQNSEEHRDNIHFYVFDLLFIEGANIMRMPLLDRKKLLKKAIEGLPHIHYVEEYTDGVKLYEEAVQKGFEGIVAKKVDSYYQSNVRGENWLKIKVRHEQEVVICGYTKPEGTRQYFGSLLLGVYQDNILHYVGHTGTGFVVEELAHLKKTLEDLKTTHSPFIDNPKIELNEITWVKPLLVCEVKFAEWTHDNILRQAVFQSLRNDKDARSVVMEKPEKTTKAIKKQIVSQKKLVHFSHPDKLYWPHLGLKKQDMLEYYEFIAPTLLPYLLHRPQSLHRFPNGIEDSGFFQKDITFDVPDFTKLVTITSEEAGETTYLVCENIETILYMANLGCIEMNPWNSRINSLDNPDYIVIDLDPLGVSFATVVTVAEEVKKVIDNAQIKAFCKTSGKKGIHIYIPVRAKYDTEIILSFAKLIASITHERLPEITSLERSPSLRHKSVYIDFLQNKKGQTMAAPYSIRPTPEATVSTPLEWDEIHKDLDPTTFTIKTIPLRIKKKGDLWNAMLSQENNLQKALVQLQTLTK